MLEAHFRAIADEGDLPIVVYNVPSRTGTNVDADTFLRLATHPRIVAVKEASGNLEQIARICRDRPRHVAVLAGDDAWTLPLLALGGDGVVSVASNEIPGELVAPVRGGPRRRLGHGPPDPRTVAAALPRATSGAARTRCRSRQRSSLMGLLDSDAVRGAAAPARCRTGAQRWPPPCATSVSSKPPAAGSSPARERGRRWHDRVAPPRYRDDRRCRRGPSTAVDPETILDDLEAGRIRAAEPDPTAPSRMARSAGRQGGDPRPLRRPNGARLDGRAADCSATGPRVPPRDDLAGGPWRIVPGGTAIRRGAHLGTDVVVMPPSYVNVGAWVGDGTMVDSHVLVGSLRPDRRRGSISRAGVTVGGVLEPPGARPVIVEDDAFVGAGCALLEGVLVRAGRRHRCRRDADRDVPAVRPGP